MARKRIAPDLIVSSEMARSMVELSNETGRQIGVLIDRSGKIDLVIVGDAKQILIPALTGIRSSGGRLKGLRCIHTHLAGENLTDDDLIDLLFLRLDPMGI
ncbi:MAG: GTPase HflX, partial [Desulfobulbaceae bacterium]|nr:GTPase HflX [Desulfobulbaceae bacterium]